MATETRLLRDETANTQFAKTLDYDISSPINLDRNGRQLITLTADTEININSITNLEGGYCELQFLYSSFVPVITDTVLLSKFSGDAFEAGKRNDLVIVWNDAVAEDDLSPASRIRSIHNTVLDGYFSGDQPQLTDSFFVNGSSDIYMVFSQDVNVSDLTDLTINSDYATIDFSSVVTSHASNIVQFSADRNFVIAENVDVTIGSSNTILSANTLINASPVIEYTSDSYNSIVNEKFSGGTLDSMLWYSNVGDTYTITGDVFSASLDLSSPATSNLYKSISSTTDPSDNIRIITKKLVNSGENDFYMLISGSSGTISEQITTVDGDHIYDTVLGSSDVNFFGFGCGAGVDILGTFVVDVDEILFLKKN